MMAGRHKAGADWAAPGATDITARRYRYKIPGRFLNDQDKPLVDSIHRDASRRLFLELFESLVPGEIYYIKIRERQSWTDADTDYPGYPFPPDTIFEVGAEVNVVQQRIMVMAEYHDYSKMTRAVLAATALDEIKRRVRYKWQGLVRRAKGWARR